jgi:chorismate mutase
MPVRGIRGAITVKSNNRRAIIEATGRLLSAIVKENRLKLEQIASVIFSATSDLNAEFPAVSARELGWNETPLLCTNEINVPRSIKKCIRVLLHVNTPRKQQAIKHVYLREATKLRNGEKTGR